MRNRTACTWRPTWRIPLLPVLRASRCFDSPHFFLQRFPFKQMINACWKSILLQGGTLNPTDLHLLEVPLLSKPAAQTTCATLFSPLCPVGESFAEAQTVLTESLIMQEVIQFSAWREIYAPLLWERSQQLHGAVGKMALHPQGPCLMAEATWDLCCSSSWRGEPRGKTQPPCTTPHQTSGSLFLPPYKEIRTVLGLRSFAA